MSFLAPVVEVAPWGLAFLALIVGTFVIYTGVTLAVALFHPDPERARLARRILADLLALFRPRQRR